MALQNEAWFIHAVSDNVTHLAQQKQAMVRGSVRTREGVVGKTDPWNRLSPVELPIMTVRDGDTTYLNPTQSKRRAVLTDRAGAVLIDEFDQLKTLTNPQSEFAIMLARARERALDITVLSPDGRTAAGAAGVSLGGILGKATTVDEAGETSSQTDIPATQQIVNGGTGGTMAKILDAKKLMDDADVDPEDRYFFYSPQFMRKLLTDNQVSSSDYNSVKALVQGGLPNDQTWVGFKWRMSTKLFKAGNIRQNIAVQKMAVGLSIASIRELHMGTAEHKWGNPQVIAKFSAGAVRVDDAGVVQVDIDESV